MLVALPRPETDANKKPKGLEGEYQFAGAAADSGFSESAFAALTDVGGGGFSFFVVRRLNQQCVARLFES